MDKPVFQRATKTQAKLRMALDGPAGSGKTFTGLIAATALRNGGKIAVIDTEHGSASKYADMFDFDVLQLTNFHPQHYIDGIRAAEEAGYSVILVDSLSHAWEGEGGVLELHDQATAREPGRNSYTSWRLVTPLHHNLVEAMLACKCHLLVTMRSKMEYILIEENGKQKPQKVGMAPIQRQGMEYEFDVVADLDYQHNMVISKTRCFSIADQVVSKPTAAWFGAIKAWLGEGAPAPVVEAKKATPAPAPVAAPKGNGGETTEIVKRRKWLSEYDPASQQAWLREACKYFSITDAEFWVLAGASDWADLKISSPELKANIGDAIEAKAGTTEKMAAQ
jgi:hypothetical protein